MNADHADLDPQNYKNQFFWHSLSLDRDSYSGFFLTRNWTQIKVDLQMFWIRPANVNIMVPDLYETGNEENNCLFLNWKLSNLQR